VKCERPLCGQTLALIGAGWFLLALYIGETGLLQVLPLLAPQGIAAGLTLLIAGSYFLSSTFRQGVDQWSDRALIAVHLTRFVGIYFLILSSHGELDSRLAIPAGWGDIAVAVGALWLLVFPAPKWALLAWNTIGLIDILFVMIRATMLRLSEPEAMAPFTELPLSFLPTMVVPLVIATHIILYVRLLRKERTEPAASVSSGVLSAP
jgi:hypothetical protein